MGEASHVRGALEPWYTRQRDVPECAVDVLQVYYLVRHLFDHVVDTNQEVFHALRVSAELASQSNHAEIIHIERCRNQLWESKQALLR